MPLLNEFFSLWSELVFVDVLLRRLIIILMNNYFKNYYIAQLPRQWRRTSSKRINIRKQRIRNWKRQKKRKKQKRRKIFVQKRRNKWGSISIEGWTHPNGYEIGNLFNNVCQACPDFYDIEIRTEFTQLMLGTEQGNGFFLGKSHNRYVDLLLPDRPGFLYYNEALQDLPVIFDTGASVSVSPDLADFTSYKIVKNGSLPNITGESSVVGIGTIRWTLYDDVGKENTIFTRG